MTNTLLSDSHGRRSRDIILETRVQAIAARPMHVDEGPNPSACDRYARRPRGSWDSDFEYSHAGASHSTCISGARRHPPGSQPLVTASAMQIWRDYLGKLADNPEAAAIPDDDHWRQILAQAISLTTSRSRIQARTRISCFFRSGLYDRMRRGIVERTFLHDRRRRIELRAASCPRAGRGCGGALEFSTLAGKPPNTTGDSLGSGSHSSRTGNPHSSTSKARQGGRRARARNR